MPRNGRYIIHRFSRPAVTRQQAFRQRYNRRRLTWPPGGLIRPVPNWTRQSPRIADAGLAHALRAVINVVQNQLEKALADGNQAVNLNPESAATYVALSYAQQANFRISEARDTLLQAVEKQPKEALAWARLAELHLMLGDKQEATDAAQKAAELAPNLGRTQITLGFTALAEFRAADAQVRI